MVPRFARPVPQYSIVSNLIMNRIYLNFRHLLVSLNQPLLTPVCLERFCQGVHDKGAALENCWGFIDGTVRPIRRPGQNQRVLYHGHKKVHALKFQSLVTPNGFIANLFGPFWVLKEKNMIVVCWQSQTSYSNYNKDHLIQMAEYFASMVTLHIH